MRELMVRPTMFEQLRERLECAEKELAHHLGALYHGGALTDPESARRNQADNSRAMMALWFDQAPADMPSRQDHLDLAAPSSIVREAVHSPLRVFAGKPDRDKDAGI